LPVARRTSGRLSRRRSDFDRRRRKDASWHNDSIHIALSQHGKGLVFTFNTLPNSGSVVFNPTTLFTDGQSTSQVRISNVNRSGVVVANGTRVTVQLTKFVLSSAGGTLIGGAPSAADPRFQVVTTLGGGATLTYLQPTFTDLAPNETRTATVQVMSLDTQDRPVSLIACPCSVRILQAN
jgi:hypothetical protein